MSQRRLIIAALGSSFAAGPGIEPIINKAAMRSGRNYAHKLAEELDADLTDLTVSGATLLNVLKEPQTASFSKEVFPPQLDSLPPSADIVTLTGGGNDLGYSGAMTIDSIVASIPRPFSWALSWWMGEVNTGVTLQQLTERFIHIADAVHLKAPNATLYLVQYATVFGEQSRPAQDIPLTQDQICHFKQRGTLLEQAYEAAAKARPEFVKLVPVAQWSQGHEVGTMDPWCVGFTLGMLWNMTPVPYHPNAEGHRAIAEGLCGIIREAQRRTDHL